MLFWKGSYYVEAIAKIASNQKLQQEIINSIQQYNLAVSDINSCLSSMQLSQYFLPLIEIGNNNKDFVVTNESNGNYHYFDSITVINDM